MKTERMRREDEAGVGGWRGGGGGRETERESGRINSSSLEIKGGGSVRQLIGLTLVDGCIREEDFYKE